MSFELIGYAAASNFRLRPFSPDASRSNVSSTAAKCIGPSSSVFSAALAQRSAISLGTALVSQSKACNSSNQLSAVATCAERNQ